MDYLRNLGSAAVSTLVQKSGLTLPFSLGQKISSSSGIYTLYDGIKRDDGSPVSIFEYDCSDPSKKSMLQLAKNSLRKLRTTRHPDVLKFIDGVDNDTTVYVMTERVKPLSDALPSWSNKTAQEREDWLTWGLHRISVALTFLNDTCSSTHGCLSAQSIFISSSGEWKLGGFELLSSPKDEASVLYTLGSLYPLPSSTLPPPEVQSLGWSTIQGCAPASADAYFLGLLLHTLFNQSTSPPATARPPHPPPPASSRGLIPNAMFPLFKRLLNPNNKMRLTAKGYLEQGMANAGFFSNNRLVQVCIGLDNFSLASEADKTSLLRTLKELSGSFPTEFASYRIMPSLINALEYGGASALTILPLVLLFGKHLPPSDYATVILTPLVKLFASPDRGTRMALLDHLSEFAEHLDKKTVSDKIWPHLQTGFSDTPAVIREATVKSISILSTKFTDRILNNDLLRHLAKMQADTEPSIRTNTCILIGRLGPSLGYHTKKKVLVPAFSRALKDPFIHARVAGLMALMATIECFEMEELSTKVIPNMSFTLLDQEKIVRDQAFKAIDLFIKRLEKHASTMPETASQETNGAIPPMLLAVPSTSSQGGVVGSAAGAAGALAGWAMSSFGKKLVPADLHSVMSSAVGVSIERTMSAPPPEEAAIARLSPGPSSPVARPTSAISPNFGSASRGKGMQLGSSKITASTTLPAELAEELENGDSNPWGSDDLIDINADQDDWSAFETAPIASPVILSPKLHEKPGLVAPTPIQPATKTASHSPQAKLRDNSSSVPPSQDGNEDWGDISRASTPAPAGTSGMSKEEKAAEMQRRKEERKQRIAQLKEQKKNATTGKG